MADPQDIDSSSRAGRDDAAADALALAARWQDLPGRVTPDQMVEEVPSDVVRDPEGGRNPDRDWMLRYS